MKSAINGSSFLMLESIPFSPVEERIYATYYKANRFYVHDIILNFQVILNKNPALRNLYFLSFGDFGKAKNRQVELP